MCDDRPFEGQALTDELAGEDHVARVDPSKDLRLLDQRQALEEVEKILRVLERDGLQRVLERLHWAWGTAYVTYCSVASTSHVWCVMHVTCAGCVKLSITFTAHGL